MKIPKINKVVIQEEIVVDKKFIEKVLEFYKNTNSNFTLCFGDFNGNRDSIINEIEKLTPIGKEILLLNYEFEKWKDKQIK